MKTNSLKGIRIRDTKRITTPNKEMEETIEEIRINMSEKSKEMIKNIYQNKMDLDKSIHHRMDNKTDKQKNKNSFSMSQDNRKRKKLTEIMKINSKNSK